MVVYLKHFIELLSIILLINTTIAYTCWHCSSDEPDLGAFCGKVLDTSALSRKQKDARLIKCLNPKFQAGHDLITKCFIKKTTDTKGEIFYFRSCIAEDRYPLKDACMNETVYHGHRIVACETCLGDECNASFLSDKRSVSTHLQALYQFIFILVVIVLIV